MRDVRAASASDDNEEAWRLAGESARQVLLAVARCGGAAALSAEVQRAGARGRPLGEVAHCLREEGLLLLPHEGEGVAAPVSTASAAPAAPLCCNVCGASGGDLQMCAGCRSAIYCGRDCQKADWRAHKAACRRAQDK